MYTPPDYIDDNPFENNYNIEQTVFPSSGIVPNMGNTLDGQPVINMNYTQFDKAIEPVLTSGLKPSVEDGITPLANSGQLPTAGSISAQVGQDIEKKNESIIAGEKTSNPLIPIAIFAAAVVGIVYVLKVK